MSNFDYSQEIAIKEFMPKKTDLNSMTAFFYAFSDDTRLKLIISLMIKPLCVGDISGILKINQTTVSHQLKILKSLNIVDCDRAGKNIIYYIKNPLIENVLNATVECI